MNIDEKIKLVTRNAEEVISVDEIRKILEEKSKPRAYIGFELSGKVHLGTGVVCGTKMQDFAKAGFETIVFLADWHSWINNKLGGDMDRIRLAGEYFQKAFEALGLRGPNVKYIWASDLVENVSYWEKVIRVAKASTLSRVLRTLPIMGRKSEGEIESAFIYYPAMQVADIFEMEIDVAAGGMDQRKAHMLARDIAEKIHRRKPACVHTPLLTGLEGMGKKMDADAVPDLASQIETKMSKSKPDTCIFIHDTEEEIYRKLKKAHCPAKVTVGNPIIDMIRYIIFVHRDSFKIERPAKYGGDVVFKSYEEFEKAYTAGNLHPLDVKNATAAVIDEIIKPAREYFEKHSDYLELMKKV